MAFRFLSVLLLAVTLNNTAAAKTSVTNRLCVGSHSADWHKCVGRLETPEGNRYEGYFEKGRPQGYGVFFFLADGPTQGDVYSGDWDNGQMSGIGTYFFSYGALYSGQYRNGIYHGLGLFYYSNGDLYRGMFRRGAPHGQGTLLQSGRTFEGQFAAGVLTGGQLTVLPDRSTVVNLSSVPEATAESTSPPPAPPTPTAPPAKAEVAKAQKSTEAPKKQVAKKLPACKGRQSAQWTACVGKIKFASTGVEYEGEFLDGRPHGRGRSKLPNGDVYVGEYLDGKRHGKGTMRSAADGSVRKGNWENGDFVSE